MRRALRLLTFLPRFAWLLTRLAWKSLRTPGFFGEFRRETARQADQLRRWKANQGGER